MYRTFKNVAAVHRPQAILISKVETEDFGRPADAMYRLGYICNRVFIIPIRYEECSFIHKQLEPTV